jgi:hypothetical protein
MRAAASSKCVSASPGQTGVSRSVDAGTSRPRITPTRAQTGALPRQGKSGDSGRTLGIAQSLAVPGHHRLFTAGRQCLNRLQRQSIRRVGGVPTEYPLRLCASKPSPPQTASVGELELDVLSTCTPTGTSQPVRARAQLLGADATRPPLADSLKCHLNAALGESDRPANFSSVPTFVIQHRDQTVSLVGTHRRRGCRPHPLLQLLASADLIRTALWL